MTIPPAERDRLVARIVAGSVPVRITRAGRERRYDVRRPSRADCLLAEEMAADALREAELDGMMTEGELLAHLRERGLWDDARQRALEGLPADVEKLKVGLYEHRDRPAEREQIRAALARAKEKFAELFAERHAHDALTCDGYARLVRVKARVALGLHRGGERVFAADDYLDDRTDLVDAAAAAWQQAQLDEGAFRELARTTPWRGVWQCREAAGSVFGTPACDWTDEQLHLCAASSLYDSVRAHPDCPADWILDDDDMLDGWLIIRHREQRKAQDEKWVEGGIRSEKIKAAQEVFVAVETPEKARAVADMNGPQARATIARRNQAVARHGALNQQSLPDMKDAVTMEKNRRATGG